MGSKGWQALMSGSSAWLLRGCTWDPLEDHSLIQCGLSSSENCSAMDRLGWGQEGVKLRPAFALVDEKRPPGRGR